MRRNIVAGAIYGRVATGSDFAFAAARRFGDAMNSYLDNDLMRRRRLLVLSAGAAISGSPVLLSAQTPATSLRRVAVLAPSTRAKEGVTLKPFFDQMRALGWIEGQTIAYDRAFADDRHEDLPRLATELVARKPELVYAPPSIAARAAWQATRTIPMVFATANDPVREGFVASLGRPGGNATGLSNISASLLPKRIQLLREILPGVQRIGRLLDPADSSGRLAQQQFAPVAASLGLTITMADSGGLFVYAPSQADLLRRSALVVDKVLRGAKPADIPVEQPTLFELVVNLKAAMALGITIPQSVLLQADRVIE